MRFLVSILALFLGFLCNLAESQAASIEATYNSPGDTPVISAGYTASGNVIGFTLNHVPATGATLTVVNNTSAAPIIGTFENLVQGSRVVLAFGGRTYPFIANYFGGTGNDLVLQWENARLLGWGNNSEGQLGQGRDGDSPIQRPTPSAPGILGGKPIVAFGMGGYVGLASTTDGTIFTAGRADLNGRTGPYEKGLPYTVDISTALPQTVVVDLSLGFSHATVLGANGSMAGWGSNTRGQLNLGSVQSTTTPVAIPKNGALAGKEAVATSAGVFGNLVLCSDGTVVGWGENGNGELGTGNTNAYGTPAAVTTSGALSGKTVISIATGRNHALALCSDGTLVSWGLNSSGQLGIGSTTSSSSPVPITRSAVLAGKTVKKIAAGGNSSYALCEDNTLVAWGSNTSGQLGIGSLDSISTSPAAVVRNGVLAGKTITEIAAGEYHALAVCSDGNMAGWGSNGAFQLGTTPSAWENPSPILVSRSTMRTGEVFIRVKGGSVSSSTFAVSASPPLPVTTSQDASLVGDNAATLNAIVNANGTATNVSFEYGTTPALGAKVAASPGTASGIADTTVSSRITGLLPGTTYYFRVLCDGTAGSIAGESRSFTTSSLAALAGISTNAGSLNPAFHPTIADYAVTVPSSSATLSITPVLATAGATVTVNGQPVSSGTASQPVNLTVGTTVVTLLATSPDGQTTKEYRLTVVRMPSIASLTSTSEANAPITANGFFADGEFPPMRLDFLPPTGAILTLVRNTSLRPIQGSFTNLTQNEAVNLEIRGTVYKYVANYYGGSGNDLVLHPADTRAVAWGYNTDGQLGNNATSAGSNVPVRVVNTGALAGKTVLSVAAGYNQSMAVCSDGTAVSWGAGSSGQLGTGAYSIRELVPVPVDQSGVLAGKRIILAAASVFHGMVLCSDGTIASFGRNSYGELGIGTIGINEFAPQPVVMSGAMAGKHVISIATAETFSIALCSDGTVYAWGATLDVGSGIGVATPGSYREPVAVDRSGVLAGKTVTAITMGSGHALALCSDGTLASWGYNSTGQLGNNSTAHSAVPVAVSRSGVLAGKTIVKIAAGTNTSMALCSDGTVAAWGFNGSGQLGDGTTTQRQLPVAVSRTGALAGKTVVDIAMGNAHAIALCSDGSVAAWGQGFDGQLGHGSSTSSTIPVLVSRAGLGATQAFIGLATRGQSRHNLAVLAARPPSAQTQAATNITASTATLNGTVSGNDSGASVSIEFGESTDYGTTLATTPGQVTTQSVPVTAQVSGLVPGITYHFRTRAENGSGLSLGGNRTIRIPGSNAKLVNLLVFNQTISPEFQQDTTDYEVVIPAQQSSVIISAYSVDEFAQVSINGGTAFPGGLSSEISVPMGRTVIPVTVLSHDGSTTKSYSLAVIRFPELIRYETGNEVPLSLPGFSPAGFSVSFELAYAPLPGTRLMVLENTALDFTQGRFTNLAHGQGLTLLSQGKFYYFVANYYGGDGNDLVLEWADTAVHGWGANNGAQLGAADGTRQPVLTLSAVEPVPSGKTTFSLAAGYLHSLALASGGSISAWGSNTFGQLGDGTKTSSDLAVTVKADGALAGKTVVTVAAGAFHSLALSSDGTVAAWGYNNHGQLGNGSTATATRPVAVELGGALAGKRVVAIAAGAYHSIARCSDGTVVTWGFNGTGALGNGGTTGSSVPVLVPFPAGSPRVTAIAAGQYHSVALLEGGAVYSWGFNDHGQLGHGTRDNALQPLAVTLSQTAKRIATGGSHTLAQLQDGKLVAWGNGGSGQLGDAAKVDRLSPVPVLGYGSGPLEGETVVSLAGGISHSVAFFASGRVAAWGDNASGQLGNGSTTGSDVPVSVTLSPDGRVVSAVSSSSASHVLASLGLSRLLATAPQEAAAPRLLAWRQQHFGRTDGSGDSADDADFDGDGSQNLVEYVFGSDPKAAGSATLPEARVKDGYLVIEFTASAEDLGVIFGAGSTQQPLLNEWQPVADEGQGDHHLFRIPLDGGRGFMRLHVTAR